MTQQSASTSVSTRGPRARLALASLGWTYLAELAGSDWVRANQLLVAFQREWNEYGSYVTDGMPDAVVQQLRILPVDGLWAERTAVAIALALKSAIAPSQWPTGTDDRNALVATTRAGSGGIPAATVVFRERLLELAPMHDEAIWIASDWSSNVGPMDVVVHLHDAMFNYIEGFDERSEADVIDQLAPSNQTIDFGAQAPISVTAIAPRRGSGSYWPWLVGGTAVVALGGILAWHKWGKGRRRR